MTAPPQTQPARTSPKNGVGYAALALGILALITSALLVGLLFGSLAVTLGIAGWEAVADNEATNRKSAIAAGAGCCRDRHQPRRPCVPDLADRLTACAAVLANCSSFVMMGFDHRVRWLRLLSIWTHSVSMLELCS